MDRLLARARIAALTLAVALAVVGCGTSGGPGPSQGAAPPVPAGASPAGQHTRTSAAGTCAVTQRDLTAAMSDLQVEGFSEWETTYETDLPAAGLMTGNVADIKQAFNATAAMMNVLSSSSGSLATAVGDVLADTGADFDELTSGQGTISDEATIVHDLSGAVADTVRICGPSPLTRYAPAQEAALDDLGGVSGDFSGTLQSLAAEVSATRTSLQQEQRLNALGPQGDGGSCTVAEQMGQLAEQIGQGDAGQMDPEDITGDLSATQQAIAQLQSDLSKIQAQGLTPPNGAAGAMARANASMAAAVATANHDIDEENSLVSQAFALANAMADIPSTSTANGSYSGSCAGDGPSDPGPFLLQHIG